jgi:hypothetical protein
MVNTPQTPIGAEAQVARTVATVDKWQQALRSALARSSTDGAGR